MLVINETLPRFDPLPGQIMTLCLELTVTSAVPLEVDSLLPERLTGMSLAEIERQMIYQGNTQVPVADFFRISGDPQDQAMVWEGDLSGVHWIGAKMSRGTMRISGNVGRHLGSEMTGGVITVDGDASDWVGGEMKGGEIHVRGQAGHLVGAAYRGSAIGMTGGTILVHGASGNEVGHSMRRGMIAVGATGDLTGFNMRAGTVVVAGACGIRHGAGMRRGTLAFLGPESPGMLGTFKYSCRYRPTAMSMLLRRIAGFEFTLPPGAFETDWDLYNGDLLEGGRGEVLLSATS